jgi:hypothetical protein
MENLKRFGAMHVLSGQYETGYAVRYKPNDKEIRNYKWKGEGLSEADNKRFKEHYKK